MKRFIVIAVVLATSSLGLSAEPRPYERLSEPGTRVETFIQKVDTNPIVFRLFTQTELSEIPIALVQPFPVIVNSTRTFLCVDYYYLGVQSGSLVLERHSYSTTLNSSRPSDKWILDQFSTLETAHAYVRTLASVAFMACSGNDKSDEQRLTLFVPLREDVGRFTVPELRLDGSFRIKQGNNTALSDVSFSPRGP